MGKSILLIEDEANIIEALSFVLSRDGWTVYTHSNGHDANDAISARQPDLVILDVMLPGKSGFEILADLRASEQGKDLPVMMLTARGQAKDRDRAFELGASQFMTKPFINDEVRAAVRNLLTE
jgi:DNA-binding response OmpR family regulator